MAFDPLSLLGPAGSLLGGIAGFLGGNDDRQKAQQLYQQNVDQLTALGVPSVDAQKISLQQLQQQGQYNPQNEQTFSQAPTEMNSIQTDPSTRAAQMQALGSLQNIAQQGGMTLEDQANLERQMQQAQTAEKGSRDAISSQMAQRGISNSGLGLAAQLSNQQQAAGQEHSDALNTAGQAQARALQALQQAGTLGGQINESEFNQQAQQKQAQDLINRFNTQNQQQVAGTNTAAGNQGQQYNLQRGDQYNFANNQIANQQEQYNKALIGQNYQQQLQKQQAVDSARNTQAGALNNQAQQTQQAGANIGAGFGAGANAVYQYGNRINPYDYLKKQMQGGGNQNGGQ